MKRIQISSYGPPDVLEMAECEIPVLRDDEILVRVQYAGINPKDCLIRKGKFKTFTGKKFPLAIGNDFAGEVLRTGKSVVHVQAGDPVWGMLNGFRSGAYASVLSAKPDEVGLKPASLSFAQAAATPLAALTALQALRDLGGKNARTACINGASGGVGTFAVQIAKAFGMDVTAICSSRSADLCIKLGADHIIDYTATKINELQQPFDIFFDVFGNQSFPAARRLLNRKGVYISTIPKLPNFLQQFITYVSPGKKAKVILFKSNENDLGVLAQMIENGSISPVIDREYPLAEAADAHRYIETKRAHGKVVLAIPQENTSCVDEERYSAS